nr:hypothetical protein [uncultured Marinifilum sp.]
MILRVTFLGLLYLIVLLQSVKLYGQMTGGEELIAIQRYRGSFVVNGDMNTYYPVVFKYGGQNKINRLKIYRSYNEAGPEALSPTHCGGLTLEIDVNYGGWGGSTYDWRIMDLRQTYHTTFGGASIAMHRKGFVVWLRGGGFAYHYESDKASHLQVCYSTDELIFDHELAYYDVYAPNSKNQPDESLINAHKNEHWDYIKGKPFDQKGHLGILTPASDYPLDVNGTIRAKEIKVEADWADFVFEEDYQLMPLSELEEFIEQNGHLPEIPTEKEVKEKGISVGEMNTKLLQKIEELTLYVIQLKKENQEQSEINENLTNRLEALEEK